MSNSNNNPLGRVMEEEELMRSISSYSQSRRRHHDHHQPLMLINPTATTEELQYQDTVVTTPFLTKTYELVDDQTTNHVVSWSKGNNSFVIWDVQMFSNNILPRYFKHNNFSSFVRQLNTYGFRKIEIDIWEFANEDFLRGHKHLLGTIKRRKPPPYPPPPHHHHQPSGQNQDRPCVEVGQVSLNQEIDSQRRGKQILMEELVRARQQQQQTKSYLKEMELRLQTTENKQQQIMTFMSIALQDTNFLEQMTQIEKRKDAEEALIQNKRRRTINQQGQCSNNIVIGQRGFIHDHDNLYGVPINLQEQYMVKEDNGKLIVGEERSFDERFWEGVEDEIDALRVESQNVGYHAQPFAQQFNYLHS